MHLAWHMHAMQWYSVCLCVHLLCVFTLQDVEYIADFCSSGETKELNSVLKLLLYAEKKVCLYHKYVCFNASCKVGERESLFTHACTVEPR